MAGKWEKSVAARLHVTAGLAEGDAVPLDAGQAHYLRHVLRLEPGSRIAVFNGQDGEWSSRITAFGKHGGTLIIERQRRVQDKESDLWLLFAPVKHAPVDFIVEKATELGVSLLWPVITQRTNAARVNPGRLASHAREAAEQSERLTVPALRPAAPLAKVLAELPAGRTLVVCDESGNGAPAAEALAAAPESPGGWALLVGPEGGFAPGELDAVLKLPSAVAIGLGPRVLRSDTAVLAAVAVFQAVSGDWRRKRREPI